LAPDADLACENRGDNQHLCADRGGSENYPFERLHDAVSFLIFSQCCDAAIPINLV
jgi:hypothetical protein